MTGFVQVSEEEKQEAGGWHFFTLEDDGKMEVSPKTQVQVLGKRITLQCVEWSWLGRTSKQQLRLVH